MVNNKVWIDDAGVAHGGSACQEVGDFTVIDCECCQFKHVVPLPTPQALESVYANEYYTSEKPLYIERYLEDKAWWDLVYAERYDALQMYLGGRTGAILDVGSGPGLFLAHGRERGWSVRGVEPSSQAVNYSRDVLQLDVDEMFLNAESAAKLGTFDAVNMGEVLEHLPDPVAMLSTVTDLLVPGGVLCLIVPNDFNPIQEVLHGHMNVAPWWVAPPHHLNYFNHQSLQALVRRAGFEVLHTESTFPIDMFLLMGKNYIGNDALGREVHGLRKVFEQNLLGAGAFALKRDLYSAFAGLGVGREVVLYARKPGGTRDESP